MSKDNDNYQLLFYFKPRKLAGLENPGGWRYVLRGWLDRKSFLTLYANMIESTLYPNVRVEPDFENVAHHEDVIIPSWLPLVGGREGRLIGTYLRWRLQYPSNKNWRYDFTRSQNPPAEYTNVFLWTMSPR